MNTVDPLAIRLGSTWYHRLVVVGGTAGSLAGLRNLTDRTLIDVRERDLSMTVTYYTICAVGCVGAALMVSVIALEQLEIVVTRRMVGAGIALTALFVVSLAVDAIVEVASVMGSRTERHRRWVR